MSLGIEAAARGAPEMAFWPAAVSIIVYGQSPSLLNGFISIIFIIAGAMTYLSLRQIQSIYEGVSERSSIRQSVSRDDTSLLDGLIADASKTVTSVLPGHKLVFYFVIGCWLVDLIGCAMYFVNLANRIINATNPETALVALISLPILYSSVVFSVLVWNFGAEPAN